MSRNRRDPHKARLRRERLRREKAGDSAGSPPPPESFGPNIPRFATERSLREIRLSELARAWKGNDPKWRAQDLAYDAMETDDLGEAVRLVNEALRLDPECTDANRLTVSILPATLENKIHLMREVVETAERNFGEDFILEKTGYFWGDVSTRPYMRAKQSLGELLMKAGELEEAAAVFARILELNPNDNQGVRYMLLGQYLAAGQPDCAVELMARFPDEGQRYGATFAWARVLERWLSGKPEQAEAALERARKVNPFAEGYISGARRLPDEEPEYFQPGKDTEAQVSARELSPALERNPAFREWLRLRS